RSLAQLCRRGRGPGGAARRALPPRAAVMGAAAPASRLQALEIAGPAGRLEALLQEREGADHRLAALVCHPHPLYGGTLHNKVVHRIATVLHGLGAAVLRFNFRGVGKSEGEHDRGIGELEDARVALAFLRERHPRAHRWAAGFSFGSWVSARLAAEESDLEPLILVAPPAGTQDFSVLRSAPVPKLAIYGGADTVAPPQALQDQFPTWAPPKTLVEGTGAPPFFDRQLGALAKVLEEALRGPAEEATSRST